MGTWQEYATWIRLLLTVAAIALVGISCEDSQSPEAPARIAVESGDNQFSRFGTPLPQPLVARVGFTDGSVAPGVRVRFSASEGAGSPSPEFALTDSRGHASTRFTLGNTPGTNVIRVEISDDSGKFAEFTATASVFYCPEEDPTFVRKFTPQGGVILFTRQSRLNTSGGLPIAGLVKITPDFPRRAAATASFAKYEEGVGRIVARDVSFSSAGDLFLAWADVFPEVMKVRTNGTNAHFASLESFVNAEITASLAGVLFGCDEFGPFVVGCRDTLARFPEATYAGVPGNRTNNDAVAVDLESQSPYFEDVYFVDLSDFTLRRLPVDSLAAEGSSVVVVGLTHDEAEGAKGMVCHEGMVYILVDTDDTKEILKVDPSGGGTKAVEYDFFSRGSGKDAGEQSDLALHPVFSFLYTIDTLNDQLLVYDIVQRALVEMFPDTSLGFDPESISDASSSGERVGLVVLP